LFLVGIVSVAKSADHPGHPSQDMALHEKFYQNWNMPSFRNDKGERITSCCNNKDCYPTAIRLRIDGNYEAWRREDGRWIIFPATLLEQNQPDMEESPDGQSHACIVGDRVVCATLGGGT